MTKIQTSLKKTKKRWIAVAAAAVFVLSVSLTIDKGTIASMPFVGAVIEKFLNNNERLDYSSYKTAIGETTENPLGKLTLNEVMFDDQRLFLSSTLQPADNVDFGYQTYIGPKVKINGKDYTVSTGGQSIEINNEMYTVYNDIELSQAIETEKVKVEIAMSHGIEKLLNNLGLLVLKFHKQNY